MILRCFSTDTTTSSQLTDTMAFLAGDISLNINTKETRNFQMNSSIRESIMKKWEVVEAI